MFLINNNKKVLIIDDDASIRKQIRYRLENYQKVDVIEAVDGESGIALAEASNPDLVILDWMLPGIQGIEVLERLRNEYKTKDTQILMLTSKNKIGNLEDVFELGANAYLTKPFSLKKLGDKVTSMLKLTNID